jgi:WD40 repeat protein
VYSSNNGYILPKKVNYASIALQGHESVINSIACHPDIPYIATAGVEKVVRVFAPWQVSKEIDYGEDYDEKTERDRGTLAFFSRLVLEIH